MQVYEEITPAEQEAERITALPSKRRGGGSVLLVQAMLSLAILLAALLAKLLVPDLYDVLRTKYDAEMQRTILIEHDTIPPV